MSRLPDGITRYKVELDAIHLPKLNGSHHVETATLEVEVIADHPTQAIELVEAWAKEHSSTTVVWSPADTPVRTHWNQEVR